MGEELTIAWCRRISEGVMLKDGRCLRRKEPVCRGCVCFDLWKT